jgi:hypothetical protein
MNKLILILILLFVLVLFGCTSSPVCGDGVCSVGESCELDCGILGLENVVVKVVDLDSNPVFGAQVSILDSVQSEVYSGTTNSSGEVTAQLAPSEYVVNVVDSIGTEILNKSISVVQGEVNVETISGNLVSSLDCWSELITPHPICTLSDLNKIREHLDWDYELQMDIDASETSSWNEGKGWEPIGTMESSFVGNLNGNNRSIINLTMLRPSEDNVGIFRNVTNANISYLKIVNANVNGKKNVGGLIGNCSAGTVNLDSVYFIDGNVSGVAGVGGLIGYQNNTGNITIINSKTTGKVSGEASGGFVGDQKGILTISKSYNASNISGSDNIGGFVGWNEFTGNLTINDSYNVGNVSGFSSGGFVGTQYNILTINNSYNIGNISGEGEVGGFVGLNYDPQTLTITNSYWNVDTSGLTNVAGGVGKTTLEMKNISTYSTWDIELSATNLNEGYPYLAWENGEEGTWKIYSNTGVIVDCFDSSLNPIPICTLNDLNKVRNYLDKNYILLHDIDASETINWNGGKGWEPIGTCSEYDFDDCFSYTDGINLFLGNFNGNNKIIQSLIINQPNKSSMGLFGIVKEGNISNIGLVDVNVNGYHDVGGLVGTHIFGSVTNSYSTGRVNGQTWVGGLIGGSSGIDILNSYSKANVSGDSVVGGLVGDIWSDYDQGQRSNISNSYSTGNVSCTGSSVGGFLGSFSGQYGNIDNCYSTGNVSGTGSYVGGFGGFVNNMAKLTNVYWDVNTSGRVYDGSHDAKGKTTLEMKQQSSFVDWDSINVWDICENSSYPWLLIEGRSC